ncbi:MAG: UDP-N-acetylmuramoyl-L-alanine--D-glutamate ligase [candidate division WOR-3 bacterium]
MSGALQTTGVQVRRPSLVDLERKSFIVLGLGRSGVAAARFLIDRGTRVMGYDENRERYSSAEVRRLLHKGFKVVDRAEALRGDWAIVSPGWDDGHPAIRFLRKRRVQIADELDFASLFVTGTLVGITGTNGKSTTTALTARMLAEAGHRVFVGGNLAPGRPLSAALGQRSYDYYVLEVSSFQLERTQWLAPRVAAVLNITADHLNRHGSREEYARAKMRIFERQTSSDFAVLGYDDEIVRRMAVSKAERFFFSAVRRVKGSYLNCGWICFDGQRVARSTDVRLPGRHNLLNALAATCISALLGVESRFIRQALVRFRGLPHRLEVVRRFRGVEFVNNSMCTNPAAAVLSLAAFDRPVVLITGGQSKGLPMGEYVETIRRRAKSVVLIGEVSEELARQLRQRGYKEFVITETLGAAVRQAAAAARPGDVVLFSPGFASFDMFRDFQDRGRRFVREVRRLS